MAELNLRSAELDEKLIETIGQALKEGLEETAEGAEFLAKGGGVWGAKGGWKELVYSFFWFQGGL